MMLSRICIITSVASHRDSLKEILKNLGDVPSQISLKGVDPFMPLYP